MVMLCRGVDFFFLLMWQQVSRDLQQVKAWLTQLSSDSLLSFQDASSYVPLRNLLIYCAHEAYFLCKRRSFCAGYFIVNRSFPALCEQESDDSIGGFLFLFSDIYYDWSDWSFTVRGSCSTPSPADRVNISSSCHYKLLSQPFKLSWWQCAIVMICYISCLAVLQWLFYFFAISKL